MYAICRVIFSEIKDAFNEFDTNKDGRINAASVAAVMRNLGISYSAENLDTMMKRQSGMMRKAEELFP